MMFLLTAAVLALQDETYFIEVIRTGGLAGANYNVGTDGKKVYARAGTAKMIYAEDDLEAPKSEKLGAMVKALRAKKVEKQYGDPNDSPSYKYILRLWLKKGDKNEQVEIRVSRDASWAKDVPEEVKEPILYMIKIANWAINPNTKNEK
jgi:hypothetical protein